MRDQADKSALPAAKYMLVRFSLQSPPGGVRSRIVPIRSKRVYSSRAWLREKRAPAWVSRTVSLDVPSGPPCWRQF